MLACFRESGKIPDLREALTILVIVGTKIDGFCLINQTGTGSRVHDLAWTLLMYANTSSSDTSSKSEREHLIGSQDWVPG